MDQNCGPIDDSASAALDQSRSFAISAWNVCIGQKPPDGFWHRAPAPVMTASGWLSAVVTVESHRYFDQMLWNIIDRRTRPYRWREVNAIVEATEHDNSCKDSDQAPESDPRLTVDYEALEAVSVAEAVQWAEGKPCPVTLYLYDLGQGFADEEHFTNVEVRFSDED
jgi:hypothetical protein